MKLQSFPITFDNHDARIRYYHLELERDLPTWDSVTGEVSSEDPGAGALNAKLPEGYRFVFYQPGDKADWIQIEISAKEVKDEADGERAWARYYALHEAELPERMIFLVAPTGEKVGTATAFYDALGADDGQLGWLHWVALQRTVQGKGLSKPLIAHTLRRLKELGYTRAHIPTQTTSWVAVKVYLDFGFLPTQDNAKECKKGWEIVNALTHHPALTGFNEANYEEIRNPEINDPWD